MNAPLCVINKLKHLFVFVFLFSTTSKNQTLIYKPYVFKNLQYIFRPAPGMEVSKCQQKMSKIVGPKYFHDGINKTNSLGY